MYSSHWYHNTWQITFLCIHCQTSVSPRPMRAAGGRILMYSSHYKIHDKVFGQNIFWCFHRITKIHGKVLIDWAFSGVFTEYQNSWLILQMWQIVDGSLPSKVHCNTADRDIFHCSALNCKNSKWDKFHFIIFKIIKMIFY